MSLHDLSIARHGREGSRKSSMLVFGGRNHAPHRIILWVLRFGLQALPFRLWSQKNAQGNVLQPGIMLQGLRQTKSSFVANIVAAEVWVGVNLQLLLDGFEHDWLDPKAMQLHLK
eukprot:EG_transcript_39043